VRRRFGGAAAHRPLACRTAAHGATGHRDAGTTVGGGGWAAASQARALALASGGRPGVARTLSGRPEALLARARIGRTLLSLVTGDRRARLAAAADLVADAALVDAAMRGAVAPSAARLEPVERRRAVLVIIDTWRELGRDLAVAASGARDASGESGASGDGQGVRDLDQLEELLALGRWVDRPALHAFLDRLDRLMLAIEGYANPELTLDHLLLAWPRAVDPASRRVA